MFSRNQRIGIGAGLVAAAAIAVFTPRASVSQYVPPTNNIPALTSGGGLVITGGKVGLTTACSTGERLEWDGSAWQCRRPNDYRSTELYYENEYFGGGANQEAASVSGTGAAATNVLTSGTVSRPGVLWIQTGTSGSGGRAARRLGQALYNSTTYTSATLRAVLGPSALSTSGERWAGFVGYIGSESAVDQTNGCYFLYDEGNVATGGCNSGNTHKLEAFSVNSSTRTRVILDGTSQDGACSAGAITTCDATLAAVSGNSTGWVDLSVVMNGTTSCEFYVGTTLCATLTNNIPSTSTSTYPAVGTVKSVGTGDRYWLLDKLTHRLVLASPRS